MTPDGFALINVEARRVYEYAAGLPAEWSTLPNPVDFPAPGGGTLTVYGARMGHQEQNVRLVQRYRAADPAGYVPNLKQLSIGPTQADVDNDRAVRPVTMSDTPKDVLDQMIRDEASRRIVAVYPEWVQRNLSARAQHLTRIETGVSIDDQGQKQPARPLTAEERSEEMTIADVWRWIGAVRDASNTIQGSPPADGNISGDTRWPPPPAQRRASVARRL